MCHGSQSYTTDDLNYLHPILWPADMNGESIRFNKIDRMCSAYKRTYCSTPTY